MTVPKLTGLAQGFVYFFMQLTSLSTGSTAVRRPLVNLRTGKSSSR